MNRFTQDTDIPLERQRQRLERLFQQNPQSTRQPLVYLRQFWSRAVPALIHRLIAGDAPRITYRRWGDTEIWRVYDPVDLYISEFTQEHEVRAWLEQRFYR